MSQVVRNRRSKVEKHLTMCKYGSISLKAANFVCKAYQEICGLIGNMNGLMCPSRIRTRVFF
jgi:hypothetical protein